MAHLFVIEFCQSEMCRNVIWFSFKGFLVPQLGNVKLVHFCI